MNLFHFSSQPVLGVQSVPLSNQKHTMKPCGFWITDMDCETNWLSWCQAENFNLDCLRYKQRIVLASNANILKISSTKELKEFHNKYKIHILPGSSYKVIDWPRVCSKFHGILITPYIWEIRLDFNYIWYNGWDCASGCIWDNRAISHLEMTICSNNPHANISPASAISAS